MGLRPAADQQPAAEKEKDKDQEKDWRRWVVGRAVELQDRAQAIRCNGERVLRIWERLPLAQTFGKCSHPNRDRQGAARAPTPSSPLAPGGALSASGALLFDGRQRPRVAFDFGPGLGAGGNRCGRLRPFMSFRGAFVVTARTAQPSGVKPRTMSKRATSSPAWEPSIGTKSTVTASRSFGSRRER